jgi:hypothetical protein
MRSRCSGRVGGFDNQQVKNNTEVNPSQHDGLIAASNNTGP